MEIKLVVFNPKQFYVNSRMVYNNSAAFFLLLSHGRTFLFSWKSGITDSLILVRRLVNLYF